MPPTFWGGINDLPHHYFIPSNTPDLVCRIQRQRVHYAWNFPAVFFFQCSFVPVKASQQDRVKIQTKCYKWCVKLTPNNICTQKKIPQPKFSQFTHQFISFETVLKYASYYHENNEFNMIKKRVKHRQNQLCVLVQKNAYWMGEIYWSQLETAYSLTPVWLLSFLEF